MGKIFSRLKNLEIFVTSRRKHKYAIRRSISNHPERLPPNEFGTIKEKQEEDSESLTESITTTTEASTSSIKCSDFYLACRNNKIEEVKELLKTMTLDEIDKVEPNGSTALHAASYHGHQEIITLLLEAGADRAIINQFNNLPFDDALNNEIKELFYRIPTSNRLISNTNAIEWQIIDDDVLDKSMKERQIIKSLYDTVSLNTMFERIEKNYIRNNLTHFDGIENIRRFFEKATKEQNPKWIIKAHTAETNFYKILNKEISEDDNQYQTEQRYIIALLLYHPALGRLVFIGPSYRAMQINEKDLQKYQINDSFMIKTFVSTSVDKKIVAWFLCRQKLALTQNDQIEQHNTNENIIQQWVMCVYNIKHSRTALHIENSSQYVNEGEVLIMPYTVFQIKKIEQVKAPYLSDEYSITQIQLEESDQYTNA